MAASYPGTVKTYTDKVDGTSIVLAADINSVQAEVNAIEAALGTNPATSLLPASAGTYNVNGVSTSLSARVGNLEAGITGNATDGTRVGYTQIGTTQTITTTSSTGSATFSSIPASYQKLVLVIGATSVTTGGAVTFTINGLGANYAYVNIPYNTGTPGATTAAASVPLGTPASTSYIVAIDFPAYATSYNGKTWNATLGGLATSIGATNNGYIPTTAITTLAVSVASSTSIIQCSLYGVK